MSIANKPDYAPTVNTFKALKVSVSSSASAAAAGVGPFRGLFFKVSSSLTIIGVNGVSLSVDSGNKNQTFWIQGEFVSVLNASAATGTNSDDAALVYVVQ